MSRYLIVTIDTEEEFDWSAPVSPRHRSVNNIAQLPRLHDVLEEYGVRPTFVVDHPVVTNDESVRVLEQLHGRGTCEIGAHLHPWVNPPICEELSPRNTYLCNLPLALQQEKTACLTDAIESAFGIRPTTFKAGRYGFDFSLAPFLRDLGYTCDGSVIAYMDFSHEDGPDFSSFGTAPFSIEPVDGSPGDVDPLLEIPCTVGFTRRPFGRWLRIHQGLSRRPFRILRPVGVLWHLGVVRKVALTPEGTTADNLVRLLRVLGMSRHVVLNLTLHSSSLLAGGSPYVRTQDDVAALVQRLRTALEFAVEVLGARCLTASEFTQHFFGRTSHDRDRHLAVG